MQTTYALQVLINITIKFNFLCFVVSSFSRNVIVLLNFSENIIENIYLFLSFIYRKFLYISCIRDKMVRRMYAKNLICWNLKKTKLFNISSPTSFGESPRLCLYFLWRFHFVFLLSSSVDNLYFYWFS